MKSLLVSVLVICALLACSASALPFRTSIDLPKAYDPRNTTLASCISLPLDQGACGSCYAFAAASTFSDRLCIFNGVKSSPAGNNSYISPQDATSCSGEGGCHGGRAIDVWKNHFVPDGGRTCSNKCKSGCFPYTSGSGCRFDLRKNGCVPCRKTCADTNAPSTVLYYANNTQIAFVKTYGGLSMEEAMRREIMTNGPVAAVMEVRANFQTFYQKHPSGIYTSIQNSKSTGSHAIRIVGWGESVEQDIMNNNSSTPRLIKWWIIANSWGDDWAVGGYFRMERGINLVGIEEAGSVLAGCPRDAPKCALTFPLTQSFDSSMDAASPKISGGWSELELADVDDQVIQMARLMAGKKSSNVESSESMTVVSVESQVVSGVNYRITFASKAAQITVVLHQNHKGQFVEEHSHVTIA